MSDIEPHAEPAPRPAPVLVLLAVRAIREAAGPGPIDRDRAATLLADWPDGDVLSPVEVAEVLSRFGAAG